MSEHERLREKIANAIKYHTDPFSDYDLEKATDLILTAIKGVAEFRQGQFMALHPQDASMLVIHRERAPELFA